MKQQQFPDCVAKQRLGLYKQQIARELRNIVRDKKWTQVHASGVLGISTATTAFILNGEEWRVSFDTLYVAACTVGLIVNVDVACFTKEQKRPTAL